MNCSVSTKLHQSGSSISSISQIGCTIATLFTRQQWSVDLLKVSFSTLPMTSQTSSKTTRGRELLMKRYGKLDSKIASGWRRHSTHWSRRVEIISYARWRTSSSMCWQSMHQSITKISMSPWLSGKSKRKRRKSRANSGKFHNAIAVLVWSRLFQRPVIYWIAFSPMFHHWI